MEERKYLYEARDADGTVLSGYIDAGSSAVARERLASRGLADIAILDDDLSAQVRACGERDGVAADKDVDLLTRFNPTPGGLAMIAVRRNLLWIAIGAGLAYWLWSGESRWWAVLVIVVTLFIPAFPAWVQWLQNEMHRSFWRGDYARSERLARRLRGIGLLNGPAAVRIELDSRIASAIAKRGDREAALALLAPWEASAEVPPSLYLSKLAHLHFLARDFARYLEIHERIAREAGSDSARIDLAQLTARLGSDPGRAAELLEGLDGDALGPMHLAFIGWGRGVLALRQGRNEEALGELARAVEEMQKMGANPVVWGGLALVTGYLCVAMARNGLRGRAAEMLASVRTIVEAHAEDLLLDMLRAEGLLA